MALILKRTIIMITGRVKNFRNAPGLSRGFNRLVKGLIVVLLLLAVLGATVVLLASFLPALLGLKAMVVTSGSMEPTIGMGDALLIRPLSTGSSVDVGYVITYRNDHNDGMTTHRVKAVKEIQGAVY